MSQRNQEVESMGVALALVGFAFFMLFALLYAVACFVAIVLTIVYACAWNNPLTIYKWTITPKEARIFIGCGVAGLIGLPVFVIFGAALFQLRVPDQWWGYILLGGYALGAIGLGSAIFDEEQKEAAAKFVALPPAAPQALPSSEQASPAEPFRFASWNDEDDKPGGENQK